MADPQIEQIKDRVNIVDFINEYTPLTRAGVYFKARCPFHNEKTPSFMVTPDRGRWHCFGCNEGGDVFTFLQKIEGLSFPEALKTLADRAGVKLVRESIPDYEKSERNRSKDILSLAAQVYHRILLDSPMAEEARQYLVRRGVTQKEIGSFLIGFAPDRWDVLTKYCTKKGVGVAHLAAAGLAVRSDSGSFFDRFRARVMFPIWDHHGSVVGFTGRLLKDQEGQGKYVNTPQTPVFDKGKLLYGLDKAKMAIRKLGEAVIVEGQMDVISCHQFGFENTIASSGTALTEDQLRLLKRYTDVLKIAFDQDAAGQHAAERGITLALAMQFDVKVIVLPKDAGKDADECLRKNVDVWKNAIENAVPYIRYAMNYAATKFDRTTAKGKSQIVASVGILIRALQSVVERDVWISELANSIGVRQEVVYEELRRMKPVAVLKPTEKPQESEKHTPIDNSKDYFVLLLGLYVNRGVVDERLFQIPHSFFPAEFHPLYELLKGGYTKAEHMSAEAETQDVLSLLIAHTFGSLDQKNLNEEYERILVLCTRKIGESRKAELESKIRTAESAGDKEKVLELLQEFKKLNV